MIIERMLMIGLRNLDTLQLELHPRLNVFVGENGSGKTSILEAFYLLSRGKSFRTRSVSPIIQFSQAKMLCKAHTSLDDEIFLEKNQRGLSNVRINEKKCQRLSDLSRLIPCQILHQDLFDLIEEGAQYRRQLIDWGLFYQNKEYAKLWQECRRLLLQRNTVLKMNGSKQDLAIWTKPFIQLAVQLSTHRADYIQALEKGLLEKLKQLGSSLSCRLSFFNGWDKQQTGVPLSDILEHQELYDRKAQLTHSGPHQADIWFLTAHGKAKVEWSRGQQKLILILLKLVQAELLQQPCLFLMDDLQAELDKKTLLSLYDLFSQINGQIMMTNLDDSLKNHPVFQNSRWFYLNHGRLENIVDC